ncbi:PREDICTED: protein JTB [Sturnus vulgaris]|uniref:protein JTB n=1 Tax=Sturnus vulgaris TaxID=9172 RepID=UPI00071A9C38|nr:PREDICTED: protein JTB [Sturnus vulgaris]
MGPGGLAVLLAVLSAVPGGLRPAAAAAAAASEERPASPAVATPCWRVEQFVVAQECTRCSGFEMKTIPACGSTGFIERINCASSHRDEYKSCRSAALEAQRFWRFVGSALGVAVAAAALVVLRQRVLDRRALEKVRKQIESI